MTVDYTKRIRRLERIRGKEIYRVYHVKYDAERNIYTVRNMIKRIVKHMDEINYEKWLATLTHNDTVILDDV